DQTRPPRYHPSLQDLLRYPVLADRAGIGGGMRRQEWTGKVLGLMMVGMTAWLAGCAENKAPAPAPAPAPEVQRLAPNQVRVKAASLPFIETKVVETT